MASLNGGGANLVECESGVCPYFSSWFWQSASLTLVLHKEELDISEHSICSVSQSPDMWKNSDLLGKNTREKAATGNLLWTILMREQWADLHLNCKCALNFLNLLFFNNLCKYFKLPWLLYLKWQRKQTYLIAVVNTWSISSYSAPASLSRWWVEDNVNVKVSLALNSGGSTPFPWRREHVGRGLKYSNYHVELSSTYLRAGRHSLH